MANFVDVQYTSLLAGQLQRYTVKNRNPFKANFRCVICGDSQKSKSKARAWITEDTKSGYFRYSCFNCGTNISFPKFLKQNYPSVYNDYIAEKYIQKATESTDDTAAESAKTEKPVFNKNPLTKIKKISQLKFDHPAKKYIEDRQIPSHQHYRIYYAPKFMTWINSIIPNKFDIKGKDEPRLIFPLMDQKNRIFGVSARGFRDTGLRYITIMFDDSPKIFGLEKVDMKKTYFVTEGAIDSMFLSNSIAMVGADTKMEGIENTENAIFIHDAEPRNIEICKRMEKLMKAGYRVCIWPATVPAKDINDMHLQGMKDIEQTIIENSFSGLEGILRLNNWKKC